MAIHRPHRLRRWGFLFLLLFILGCSEKDGDRLFNPADAPYPKVTDDEFRKQAVILEKNESSAKPLLRRPVAGEIVRTFGKKNEAGPAAARGIDFVVAGGGPVMAAHKGRVIYVSSFLKGWGKVIIIEAADGFKTVYAHRGKNQVIAGQEVESGSVLALLAPDGNGKSTLYFEFRRGDIPEDPAPYFEKA